jgi:hypothetical protein
MCTESLDKHKTNFLTSVVVQVTVSLNSNRCFKECNKESMISNAKVRVLESGDKGALRTALLLCFRFLMFLFERRTRSATGQ